MKDGIEILPRSLDLALIAQLRVEGRSLRDSKVAREHTTENGWRINVIPSRVKSLRGEALIRNARLVVDHIANRATTYLGPKWGVSSYIWDYSGVTRHELFPMHTDDFKGFRAMKAYVYLEDCAEDQGALVYEGKKHGGPVGTVLLFDPSREHGSYHVTRGSRYIFRAHLVERAYVLRHLPDQLPWYLRPVSRIMGKLQGVKHAV